MYLLKAKLTEAVTEVIPLWLIPFSLKKKKMVNDKLQHHVAFQTLKNNCGILKQSP